MQQVPYSIYKTKKLETKIYLTRDYDMRMAITVNETATHDDVDGMLGFMKLQGARGDSISVHGKLANDLVQQESLRKTHLRVRCDSGYKCVAGHGG